MKPSLRSSVSAIGVLLILASLGGFAQADTLDEVKQAKKLRVATDLGNPPFGMKSEKLEPIGVDVEVAKAIAKDLGVTLEIVATTGPNRIPFLTTNKADIIISTLSRRPEREKVIDYADMPYGYSLSVVGAPKNMDIKNLGDLTGKRIAVTRNTTNDTDITQRAPGAIVVRFDDESTTITAVVTNQVDIIAQSPEFLDLINQRNPSKHMEQKFILGTNHYGIGLRKDNPKMMEWLNNWLAANFDNGTLNKIFRRYLNYDLAADLKTVWKKK